MRLIDADALKAKWYDINDIDENDRGARFVGYTEIARLIDQAPTVSADAVSHEVKEDDKISRADAIKAIRKCKFESDMPSYWYRGMEDAQDIIEDIPSADAVHGEWVEKEVMVDEDTNITEWQSARCSVCGKYHTTPCMYYFDNFNFCPNCGAKMDKGGGTE